ncbi:MAG: hypothetical protein KatS3mg124_1508 [Porticoccaceae bacterium]|nr:MAG: hypothetical protein KatS3mg124_1508 [Porticoccaceae bacterium]
MSPRTLGLDERLHQYLIATGTREHPLLARLREETARLPEAGMQIAPEQGALLGWLVALMGARRILEIGTFTGYSSLAMALALPEGGQIHCCDLSERWTAVARRYWREAGVEARVQLHLGQALDSLDEMLRRGMGGAFDLAFIDADKENYESYFERCLALVRPGGVIAVDNLLWGGRVVEAAQGDPATAAIRRFNEARRADERVDWVLLPVGDGLGLMRVRG